MSAGRKPTSSTGIKKPELDHELIARDTAGLPQLAEHLRETQASAVALAEQLGYEGALTVPGLEDEIRFYQRRSVEAVFELGKRLSILKEMMAHGEFRDSLSRLGIHERMAQRFMLATAKLSNTTSKSLLSLPGMNQTKLLELVVLDDNEIEAIASGESAFGLTLDDIDCMSVSEMKTAIRKAKREQEEEKAAQEEIKRRRDERVNALEEEIARLTSIPKTPAMIEEEQIAAVMAQSQLIVREVEAGLRGQLAKLERLFEDGVLPNHVRLAQQQAVTQILQAARILAGDFGITLKLEDQEPQQLLWLKNAETLFGDTAPPADDAADLLPPDGE